MRAFIDLEEQVRDNYVKLSENNLRFYEFIKQNPNYLENHYYDSLKWPNDLFKLQPWPTYINERAKREFHQASANIFDLIKKIPKVIFNNDPKKISQYYQISLDIIRLELYRLAVDKMNNLLARGDFIISPLGLKCLEFNVSANLGGWDLPLWEALYFKISIISEFIKRFNIKIANKNMLSVLLEYLLATAKSLNSNFHEFNLALVLPARFFNDFRYMESYINHLFSQLLIDKHLNITGKIILCDYNQLKICNNRIFYQKIPVHTIIEMYHGIVPLDILELCKSRKVNIFNGPITGLFSSKSNLALLSENVNSDLFSGDEKKIIEKYIPWSRRVEEGETIYRSSKIKIVDFVRAHRRQLVMKPANGYGGEGILIGKNTHPDLWEESLKVAIRGKNYIVQEYVESLPYIYHTLDNNCDICEAVWGFFLIGSIYGGAWVRVLPKTKSSGIINCHQGATVSPVFETVE